jgi:hemerythrin
MGLYDWKPEYSIGCPPIDLQHKQMFRMAAELHQAMVNNEGSEVTNGMIERGVAYVRFHFASEERMMLESGFPGYEEHRVGHEKQLEELVAFQEKAKASKGPITMEVIGFLRDWLVPHIQKSDRHVGMYLSAPLAIRSVADLDDAKLAV